MKSIIKWFFSLIAILFFSLILYQNYEVLLEKKTFYLFSEGIFGFNYGSSQLPLIVYFAICVALGALFMAIPASVALFKARRIKKKYGAAVEEEPMMPVHSPVNENAPFDDEEE